MRLKIKIGILKALLACDGMPMPESALYSAVELLLKPLSMTASDFEVALKEGQSEGFVQGVTDEFSRTWTLTDKGTHKARKL